MTPRLTPLAALLPVLFTAPAWAASQTSLDTIVVTATRQQTRASDLLSDVTVIDHDEIEKAGPNTTVTELLARQSGVEMTSNGAPGSVTNVFIRGSNSDHVLVLVDGMRVNSATLGTVSWSYLPLSQIERIEILRGPASSLYGSDAIGGVIQIFTRRGEGPAHINAEIGYGTWNTYSAQTGVQGSARAWHYSLQVADQHSDGYSSIHNLQNRQFNPDHDGFTNQSASGTLSYTLANGHEFGGRFLHSEGSNHFDASYPASVTSDYKQRQTVSSYSLFARDRFLPNWTSTLRAGRGTDDSRSYHDNIRYSGIRTDQNQFQWQNDIGLPYGIALLSLERLEQKVSSDTTNYSRKHRTIDSVVLGWRAHLAKHRLQFNGRYDDNSQFGGKTSGSAAYGYQITNAWRANVSYGTAFKAPTFNQLYWPNDGSSVGNPNLKPETALNREFSLHYDADGQRASLTYFRNDIHDLIDWHETSPGSWFYIPENISDARITGWSFVYDAILVGFNIHFSADFQNPRNRETSKLLQRRSTEHGVVSIGRNFGAWNWTTELVGSGRRFNDAANTERMGGYALLNLQTSHRLGHNWNVFARANNILDKEYELVRDYGTAGANVFVGIRYAPE